MPNGDPIQVIITPAAQEGLDKATASLKQVVSELVAVSEAAKRMEGTLRAAGNLKEVVNGQREVAESVRQVNEANKAARDALKLQKAEEKQWQRMLKEEADQNKRAAKERADSLRAEEKQRRDYEKWWADAIKARQKLEADAAKERERISNLEARRAENDINAARRSDAAGNRATNADPLNRANARYEASTGNDARDIALLNEQTRQANAANRQWAQSINYAEDSLAQMRVNVEKLRLEFSLLTREERNNVDVGGRLTEEIADINRELDRHAVTTGRASSSYNGLGNSVQRIAQELPNLSQGFGLFARAIGNNISGLQEEWQRASAVNAALRAEGRATVPVIRQLVSSIISWQTAILVLTTLFVTYADEIGDFFSELVKGKEVLTDVQVAQQEYNKVLKESSAKAAEVSTNISVLRARFLDAKASVQDKKEVIKDLNKEYGDTIGKIGSINDAEKFFRDKSASYVRAVTLRAQADAARNLIIKEQQALLEAEIQDPDKKNTFEYGLRKTGANIRAFFSKEASDLASSTGRTLFEAANDLDDLFLDRAERDAGNRGRQRVASLTQMLINFEREADAIANTNGYKFDNAKEKKEKKPKKAADTTNAELKADEDIFKYRMERIKQQTRQSIEANKTIMEDESVGYLERMNAAQNYSEERLNLVKLERAQEEGVVKVALDKIAEIENKAVKSRTAQENNLVRQKEALQEKYKVSVEKFAAEEIKTERESADARMKITEDVFKQRQKITELEITENNERLSAGLSKELEGLAEQYAKRNLTREQYESAAAMATRRVQSESLLFALDLQDEEIKQAKRKNVDTVDLERKSADLRIKIQEDASQAVIRSMEAEAEARQALFDSFKELSKAIADTLFKVADQSLERDKENLDKRKESVQDELEEELDNINLTMRAGVEKEEAIIDAKAEAAAKERVIAAQQEQIDKKRIQLNKLAQAGAALAQGIQTGIFLQAKVFELNTQALQYGAQATAAAASGNLASTIAFGAAAGAAGSAAAVTQSQVPLLAAITAAQIAGILAFEKGTNYSPEGWALTDEKGPELYIPKSGDPFLGTDNGPTLRYLQEGTKIIPNHEIAAYAGLIAGAPVAFPNGWGAGRMDTAAIVDAVSDLGGTLAREIRNKPENKLIITARGLQHMSRTGANTNTYLHSIKH